MEAPSWIMIAVCFWIFGYFKSKLAGLSDGRLVQIPKWMNILFCAYPQSKEIPNGLILSIGLWFQLTGWLFLLYGLFARYLIQNGFYSFVVGLAGSLIIGVTLVDVLDRR
jgi:hypothetical protein